MVTSLRARSGLDVQALAAWASSLEPRDIPPAVMRKGAQVLADDLAAMIGARDEPEVTRFHSSLARQARLEEATVWGGRDMRTDRLSAAAANAVSTSWLELDEGYRATPCHAGLYVLPALLSQAEASDLTCADLLRALVLGYEIVTRVARAWPHTAGTMQAHGRYCAIGAAAGIGLAKRLQARELAAAMGAAATLIGPAPRSHLVEGALIRNAWAASGAWNGMMAVEWAGCGINGIPEALHDVYVTVLGGEARPELLVEQLGVRWAVMDGYTKIYACCQHLHSAVEAALDLRRQNAQAMDPEDIASVVVRCHPLALPFDSVRPLTTLGAKFSMPHALAAALVLGDAGAKAFDARSLENSAIARLRAKVRMDAWSGGLSPPNDRPAAVAVTMTTGQVLAAECLSARGGPDRPLPEDTWIHKMRELAAPVYPSIVGILEQIVQGEPRRLCQAWPEIVREICAERVPSSRP